VPKASILIPAFRAKYLNASIESALNQTFTDFELLVSDDSDGDEIQALVNSWKDRRIKYFKNPNRQAPGANRDFLISQADGDFIKFLFDDDLLMPHSLEYSLVAAEKTDADLVFHGKNIIDANGRVISSPSVEDPGKIIVVKPQYYFERMVGNCKNLIGEPTNLLIRTKTLKAIARPFDLDGNRMRFLTDMALYTNFMHRSLKVVGMSYIGSSFRKHISQSSSIQTSRNSNSYNPIYSAGIFEWELLLRWSIYRGHITIDTYLNGIEKRLNRYRDCVNIYPELNLFINLEGSGDFGCYYNKKYKQVLEQAYRIIEFNQKKLKQEVPNE